jgi:hypothetical protein
MLKYEIFSFKIGIITIGINNIIKRCLKLLKNNINNILRLYPAVKVIGLRWFFYIVSESWWLKNYEFKSHYPNLFNKNQAQSDVGLYKF